VGTQGRYALLAPLAVSLAAHVAAVGGVVIAGRTAGIGPGREAARPVARVEEPERRPPRGELVVAAAEEAGSAAEGEAIPLDTEDPRYHDYLHGVRQRIWARWHAPRLQAAQLRGALLVEFSLAMSGRVTSCVLRQSSGRTALDDAALAAVRGADPFAPFPVTMARDSLVIRTRFVYE
jgi:TonB family protein